MFNYNINKQEKMPMYEAVYVHIREMIMTGELVNGEKLPSKRNLASRLDISVNTIENAYSQLMLEGYIHSEQGRGFFVNEFEGEYINEHKTSKKDREKPALLKEEEEPEYVMDFKSNQSSMTLFPFATWSKLVRNTLSDRCVELLDTVPYNGLLSLREAIANYLKQVRNMRVYPEQIIIGAGTEFLYGRLLQLLGSDSIVAIEDPGYKKFATISSSQGILWDYIPVDEGGMRIDRLKNSKANIVHASPANHFPTGTVMPIKRRMELLDWAYEDQNRYIIEDDYDSELRYVGKIIPTLYAMDDKDKVIYMNTFSKSLVPSIRISYMVLPPLLVSRYRTNLSFYSCTVSSFEQITLAKFINDGYFERHINRMKMYYREKRDVVINAIRKSKLAKIAKIEESDAGTHFVLSVNTKMTDEEIRAKAIESGIHIAMLSDYETYPSIKNSRKIVMNYAGIDIEKIDIAVELLEKIFERR